MLFGWVRSGVTQSYVLIIFWYVLIRLLSLKSPFYFIKLKWFNTNNWDLMENISEVEKEHFSERIGNENGTRWSDILYKGEKKFSKIFLNILKSWKRSSNSKNHNLVQKIPGRDQGRLRYQIRNFIDQTWLRVWWRIETKIYLLK